MAETKMKQNTVKFVSEKIANNHDENDYKRKPIGADSDNVDRPDGSTVEESLSKIEFDKVEIVPVETLPESDIKEYPYIYALVKPNVSKGTLYEYRDSKWIPYGNSSNGIWVGTKENCVRDFDNIEEGTIVIIIKKDEGSEDSDTHTHDYVCQITKTPTYSEPGTKTYTCFICGDSYTEEIPALVDSINPAGVIRIGNNEYATWKDTISFETYTNQSQTVTIEASDNETGIKEIAYYLANAGVSDSNIGTVTWIPYAAPFTIEPNNNYIVYAKITDNADNVSYICSDGIVLDNIPPVFEGMEDGETYPTGTVLTVEEGATLTVNGEAVELVNNTYTFNEVMDNCLLSVSDRAGNSSTISVAFMETAQAPADAHNNWDYMLNDSDRTISLLSYKGNETDIILYNSYEVDGKVYKTKIVSNYYDSSSGNYHESTLFLYSKNKNEITSITFNDNVDTSGITNMKNMFSGCYNLKNISFGNNFNTSNVTSMENVFYQCWSLEELDLSCFDTSNVTNMSQMFKECREIVSLNLTSFDTSNVTDMSQMFYLCHTFSTNLNLTSFDTSNVTDMNEMFRNCKSLTSIEVTEGKWITSQANTKDMFNGCGVSEVTYV